MLDIALNSPKFSSVSRKLVHNQPNNIDIDLNTQLINFIKWIRNARIVKGHNYRVGMTCHKTFNMTTLSRKIALRMHLM